MEQQCCFVTNDRRGGPEALLSQTDHLTDASVQSRATHVNSQLIIDVEDNLAGEQDHRTWPTMNVRKRKDVCHWTDWLTYPRCEAISADGRSYTTKKRSLKPIQRIYNVGYEQHMTNLMVNVEIESKQAVVRRIFALNWKQFGQEVQSAEHGIWDGKCHESETNWSFQTLHWSDIKNTRWHYVMNSRRSLYKQKYIQSRWY